MSANSARPTAPDNSPPGSEDDAYAVLRNPDFLLYVIARFIGSFGQQMLTVAVGWEIFERTGSYIALGLVGLVQILLMDTACFQTMYWQHLKLPNQQQGQTNLNPLHRIWHEAESGGGLVGG